VGGTRGRHFAGTNSQPRKLPENAQTPTRRVHAVLGGFDGLVPPFINQLYDGALQPIGPVVTLYGFQYVKDLVIA
jgi:hypothetical protein